MSQQVGPISFSVPQAFEQLRDEGVAVSFRASDRTTGYTWANRGYGEHKEFDVFVEWLMPIVEVPGQLDPFVGHSGFDSVEEWARAIDEMHGKLPREGNLYRVERVYPEQGSTERALRWDHFRVGGQSAIDDLEGKGHDLPDWVYNAAAADHPWR